MKRRAIPWFLLIKKNGRNVPPTDRSQVMEFAMTEEVKSKETLNEYADYKRSGGIDSLLRQDQSEAIKRRLSWER
jgi:hypothetical protein